MTINNLFCLNCMHLRTQAFIKYKPHYFLYDKRYNISFEANLGCLKLGMLLFLSTLVLMIDE